MDGHPLLKQKNTEPLPVPFADEVLDLISKTGQALKSDLGFHANKASATCASQVGTPYRLFVTINCKSQNPCSKLSYITSPKALRCHTENHYEEGCLSILTLLAEVKRHNILDAEYFNLDGKLIQRQIQAREALVFQHEGDHLDGILMTGKVQDPKRRKSMTTILNT